MTDLETVFLNALRDVYVFARDASGLTLRDYQRQVAAAIVDSVIRKKGKTFVVIFPRQSGKNELQAQIEAYLLTLLQKTEAEIVKVSPTWKPQTQNAMRRLQRVMERNFFLRDIWRKEAGYIYRVNRARIIFLSGSPTANVVGATASTLLECDEAQDVTIAKWDKDFAPMAASTNATRVFWGTAWTSKTLLARELRNAQRAQAQDGEQRVFVISAEEVAAAVPAYGAFVREQIARLGRNHPFVRTQYFSEEIEAEGGLFPASRLALMKGDHPLQSEPRTEGIYAITLDVAGEDEAAGDELQTGEATSTSRDSTALTVFEVDLTTLEDPLIHAPTYRVVQRSEWVGVKHTWLYAQIKATSERWRVRYLVVDATGVGAGLASFLDKALPGAVIPFVFSARSKSDLGWKFLALIESGRFKDFNPSAPGGMGEADLWSEQEQLQRRFFAQAEACQSEVLEGPGKLLRWGVPAGSRDPASGEPVHDDLLVSAALCAVLEGQRWGLAKSEVIAGVDPLAEMGETY